MFVKYDVENDVIIRDEDGMCVQVPQGQPGLLLAEITGRSRFEGYANASQTNNKIVRVCLVLE